MEFSKDSVKQVKGANTAERGELSERVGAAGEQTRGGMAGGPLLPRSDAPRVVRARRTVTTSCEKP